MVEEQQVQVQEQTQPQDTAIDKMMEIYDQIATSEDIVQKTAAILTISNYYNYALYIANEINGRQGKNRLTVTGTTSKLMGYSFDTDVDEILDKRLRELLVGILNTYLSDKQELPASKPRQAAGIESRVKALMIMLVTTNNYSIIPLLNIPRYILGNVSKLFENIRSIKDDAIDSFVEWLRANGNEKMAEIVLQKGNDFWGSEGIKANVIYDRYFGELAKNNEINKPVETYNMYLHFRAEYRKSTKNIIPSKIYNIFDITPDAYNKARSNVYHEIKELLPEDEDLKALNLIIFENENG